MTGTALHTNESFQYLVLDKIVIAFTAKIPCVISKCISVINMRICNMLLNFFVSVYNDNSLLIRLCTELDLLLNSDWPLSIRNRVGDARSQLSSAQLGTLSPGNFRVNCSIRISSSDIPYICSQFTLLHLEKIIPLPEK